MANFEKFCRTASKFAHTADFLTIYIEEAHPTNGWNFRTNVQLQSHKTLADRAAAGHFLAASRDTITFPIALDTMANKANDAYGAMPERLYVIVNERVVYCGKEGPSGYLVEEVEEWLMRYEGEMQTSMVDGLGETNYEKEH